MAKVAVLNQIGEKVSDLDLNPKVFGLEEVDGNLVHSAVRVQRNNLRKGKAHTKNRGEVAGSGKKPWKQKGTGRARAGSVRSPLWRHGGITFGPRSNRNWSLKMNKGTFRKALFTILTDKLNDKKLVVIDSLEVVTKTKDMVTKLTNLASKAGLGKKLLVIVDKPNKDLVRALNNAEGIKSLQATHLNVLDLLHHDIIATKDAISVIEKVYLK
jgi:large subunit ribosomal protein L4